MLSVGVKNLFYKESDSKFFGIEGICLCPNYVVSPLWHENRDYVRHGCIPIKIFLQKQVASQNRPTYSLIVQSVSHSVWFIRGIQKWQELLLIVYIIYFYICYSNSNNLLNIPLPLVSMVETTQSNF
jgi:hypothetical protein